MTDAEAARERVIDAFERSAEIYGLNRSYGRLYGILYFAHEPLSLDELADESGFAKSTVSTGMKELERFHMVHRRSVSGEGKKGGGDFWHILKQFLDREVRREIDTMARALDDAEAALEAAVDAGEDDRAARDLEHVRDLQQVYARSEAFVNLVTRAPSDRLRSAFEQFADFVRR